MNRELAALFDVPGLPVRELAGGSTLYREGDAASAVYLVRAGALAVMRGEGDMIVPVAIVKPGEIVGESALLAGTARTATVLALRDSEVIVLESQHFFSVLATRPAAMTGLAQLLVSRARSGDPDIERSQPKILAIISASTTIDAAGWADDLATAMAVLGVSAVLLTSADAGLTPAAWSALEAAHDVVLCAVECDEPGWSQICQRQVDRILLIGCGTRPPPVGRAMAQMPLQRSGLVDLVLVGRDNGPVGAWVDAVRPARFFRVADRTEGIDRLARMLTGNAIALVLSGGGARAFAHVGAVRALRRAGVPVDAVCGTSMGAIIAAAVAAGWTDDEIDARMRKAFVDSSPLDDIALPFVAMTRGRKVEARLRDHFGDGDIADLRLPCFCVSTDLNAGCHVVHRRGPLVTALRASIALPGILPPVVTGDQVLVDGGVLRNLPSELMRAEHGGTIIGVDVSNARGLMADDIARPSPLARWFLSGSWRRGPPIVSILMRAATVGAGPDLERSKTACDLYVMPDVETIEIRNWRAYDRAVSAGDAAMTAALAGLDLPPVGLRKRRVAQARTMGM